MSDIIARQPIVVGIDGSGSARQAALWAADVAAHRRVPLRLVHAAVGAAALTYGGGSHPPQVFFDALKTEGRRQLTEAQLAVRQAHPTLVVEVDLLVADPVRTLIEASGTAQLLVLGSRGLGGFSGILVGSTAVSLAAHGRCPVAVIRGHHKEEAPPSSGSVVVGVDGSAVGESAIMLAFEEASARGTDLLAVHTWAEFDSDNALSLADRFFGDIEAIETREKELLAERLAGWQEKYPEVSVRRLVTRDRPARCLVDLAADAQLMVVGSRGRGGFAGMLQGSTSQALIYHAPCPLIVVRPTATH